MRSKSFGLAVSLLLLASCASRGPLPTPEPVRRVYLPIVARGDELPLIFDCAGAISDAAWLRERFGAITWTQGTSATLAAIYARCGDQPASVTVYVERNGEPAEGVEVVFSWPDGSVTGETNGRGEVGFGYGGGAYYFVPNGGPHSITVGQATVSGLGMLGGTDHEHVDLGFTIR